MASVLAWLDNDDMQQQRMRELVELFKDESTVDELGIGTIRDTFSDALFPGTSVLHTRARYLLFVGWLVRDVARHGWTSDRALAALRTDEIKLIEALLAGGEDRGVIGGVARSKLKRMPSAVYWAGMGRLEVRTWDLSIAGHFRAAAGRSDYEVRDPDSPGLLDTNLGIDANLPPRPTDLLTRTNFHLRPEEASYLRDRIAQSGHGTLFAWLALHGRPADAAYPWMHPQLAEFPTVHRRLLDHARRFHHVVFGAALLYNLLLAEKQQAEQLQDRYRSELLEWQDECAEHAVFDHWDRGDFWATILSHNQAVRPATRTFVDQWMDVAGSGGSPADDHAARSLIALRERRLKGSRSRLDNTAALNAWSGEAGLVRLDYRWRFASSHLNDLYAGLEVV